MKKLEGKVAVVTGGSRDIGRAVSLKLAAECAKVRRLPVLVMRRVLLLALCALATSLPLSAQPSFRADGTFKILQLTDLHLKASHPEESAKVFARIDRLVGEEAPDFIAITGDLVFGKPAKPEIEQLVGQLDSYGIPWAVVYGNHDAEQELSRPDMSALYASGKNTLNKLNAAGELADLEIPVMKDGVPAYYIYMLDSHDYSPDKSMGRYAWFNWDQVSWMRESCRARTSEDGTVAPSVAFFHIPLCEYVDAWAPMDNSRLEAVDRKHCIGMRGESIACGGLNSGMFAAMKEGGSIVATFCGHDHDSDYVACYRGIALCYGRFSGCNTVYNNIPCGGRVIVLNAGTREFKTWVRDDDGRVIWHCRTDGNEIVRYGTRPKGGEYGQWCDE